RVPSNAKSFTFQHSFFTREYPKFICNDYDDFFVTMMDPVPAGLADGNIAFDSDGNPVSVNTTLLQVCTASTAGNKTFTCPLAERLLSGTGFETHAATGWLTTTTPVDNVRGKVITLSWAIWDQGDGRYDSTALVDDFEWSIAPSTVQTNPSPPR